MESSPDMLVLSTQRLYEALRAHGYAFIKAGSEPILDSEQVARLLGSPLHVPGLEIVQVLRPRQMAASPKNIYSGNYGVQKFPLHTDLAHWYIPPRYFMLRCVEGSPNVKTLLLDSRDVIAGLDQLRLTRAWVQPRKPLNGRRPMLRVFDGRLGEHGLFRWDKLFTKPATLDGIEVCKQVEQILDESRPQAVALSNAGDILLVDNWRMLHGRSCVGERELTRRIDRVYFESLR